MKSFTRMIRAKVWPLKALKASDEAGSKVRSEMQALDWRDLQFVVGGDETDGPKGSWLANRVA